MSFEKEVRFERIHEETYKECGFKLLSD